MASRKDTILTADEVRRLLHYDPATGCFTWLRREGSGLPTVLWNGRYSGQPAGGVCRSGGRRPYRVIAIHDRRYMAHRLAWIYMTGAWPPHEIDHRDGDGTNNRWDNLRSATHQQNLCNAGVRRHSRLGVKGVEHLPSGRYHARIRNNGVRMSLGTYDTVEEAHAAYVAAAKRLHGEFANAG